MVQLGLVMLLQSSFVGTKSVGIASVGIVWCTLYVYIFYSSLRLQNNFSCLYRVALYQCVLHYGMK